MNFDAELAEAKKRGRVCAWCGRPQGEHSYDTRHICNGMVGGGDDVRRAMSDCEGDAGGTGQDGLVSGDAAGQEDLRSVAAMNPVAWRWTNQFGKEVLTSNRDLAKLMEDKVAVEPLFLGDWQTAKVSIDMDTHFDGNGLRVFGRVVDWQPEDWEAGGAGKGIGLNLLCEYESDNFGMRWEDKREQQTANAVDSAPSACTTVLSIGEVQREFYAWWKANQVDRLHGMIAQNCALAAWQDAYNRYVRETTSSLTSKEAK